MNRLLLRRLEWTAALAAALFGLAGCATESHHALDPPKPLSVSTTHQGEKYALVVAKFDNRSSYMRGLFSDGVDRLGGQAKTSLVSHLQQTGYFDVMDRENMEEIAREAGLGGKAQRLLGAEFAITGNVVDFGRREVGDQQLFGILGRGKTQVAYSRVTLNVVDVVTSQVVYSVSGAGEYALSHREVLGFGGTSGYDSTLNGKVIDLAVREAVDRLVDGVARGEWRPTK